MSNFRPSIVSLTKTAKFKTGDIVVLSSGGPLMCVRHYLSKNGKNPDIVKCDWFAEGEDREKDFLADQLLSYEDLPSVDENEDTEH